MQISSKTCNPVKYYLIRHNITLNLTESLVNKTNVTFNRVQKGNSYYFVQIIPYHTLGNIGNSATSVFYIGGQFYHKIYLQQHYDKFIHLLDTLFPPPFNLGYIPTTSNLSSVTISWVAPLDTPLCVHSYTVTVRNSCNSSQVMIYNTTDNRSSLSITDLTSDGEYSVTVAGRDGAGRIGQESEELIISKGICMSSISFFLQCYCQFMISSQNCNTWL